jgi:pimeloyl-ACP methyl ester carboxylesterase
MSPSSTSHLSKVEDIHCAVTKPSCQDRLRHQAEPPETLGFSESVASITMAAGSADGSHADVSPAIESMPDQLVDVGGHKLHLYCAGSGSPTVVLEPGAGEMSSFFGWIAPEVARDTRICVCDRAGRGWSESADVRGHIPGPYVLAGHSFGGLYVLTFAARYPDEVAGMVLLDSTAPASDMSPPDGAASYDVMGRISALLSASAPRRPRRWTMLSLFGTSTQSHLSSSRLGGGMTPNGCRRRTTWPRCRPTACTVLWLMPPTHRQLKTRLTPPRPVRRFAMSSRRCGPPPRSPSLDVWCQRRHGGCMSVGGNNARSPERNPRG